MHTYILLTLFLAMVVLVFTTLRKHKKRDKKVETKKTSKEDELKDKIKEFEQHIKDKKERFLTIFWYKDNVKAMDEYAKKKHKYKFTHIENCETFDKYWFEFDYD